MDTYLFKKSLEIESLNNLIILINKLSSPWALLMSRLLGIFEISALTHLLLMHPFFIL